MPRFIAQTLMKACVWSVVEQTTASMSFCSRHFRQSIYVFALGNCLAAAARFFPFKSHRATMFSLLTLFILERPRPPTPMTAILSFSFGELPALRIPDLRTMSPAPAIAPCLRNVRRFIRRFMNYLLHLQLCLNIVYHIDSTFSQVPGQYIRPVKKNPLFFLNLPFFDSTQDIIQDSFDNINFKWL